MKNIINTSELQRKGLKDVYNTIDQYGEAFIINQRSNKTLRIIDNENPRLLINIIKSIKRIKEILKTKYKITSIAIVGSFARGENNPTSDLDLMIDYKINDLKEFYFLEDFFKKELKINNIDLLPEKNISGLAISSIKKECIYV